jgi:uncharacterized low-complexity protein
VETMNAARAKTRKWAVVGATLAATLAAMLAASVAFGEAPTPCEVTYLMSGSTAQQPSLEGACGPRYG